MSSATAIDKLRHNIKEMVVDFEKETFSIVLGMDVKVTGTFKTKAINSSGVMHFFVEIMPDMKGVPHELSQKVKHILSNRIVESAGEALRKVMPLIQIV